VIRVLVVIVAVVVVVLTTAHLVQSAKETMTKIVSVHKERTVEE
jgi:preprotein translocase subunit SecG